MRIGRLDVPSFRRHPGVWPGLCLIVALGSVSQAPAVTPVREVCDQIDSGERIKCKFGNVIEQQRGAAETMGQMGMLPPGQEETLIKHVGRAGRVKGRMGALEFKQLTRKSQVSCQTSEILGDGKGDDDGICASGEDCQEVLGDQIGDDDGICRPRNGMNREVCVEICDADAVNADPNNFDDDPTADSTGRDLEESLDDLTDQYEGINLMMLGESSPVAEASSLASATGACAAAFRQRPSSVLLAVLVGAAEGARVAADVSERFCDQAAFGFSGSSVCAVVEGVAGAAMIIARAYEVEDSDIDSRTIDSIWACLKETSTTTSAAAGAVAAVSGDLMGLSQLVSGVDQRVGGVDQRVSGVDDRVGVLDQKVNSLAQQLGLVQQTLVQVIILLNTPQGQRPGFPTPTAP